jgi:hypothetical protein
MSKKLLQKALSAPNNLRFGDMVKLAETLVFGFRDRMAAITSSLIRKLENC